VTSLAVWRQQFRPPAPALCIYYESGQWAPDWERVGANLLLAPSFIAAVSGDSGGEIVLCHCDVACAESPLTKVAVMQLGRSPREGVAVLAIDSDVIVAGGSEGTVAIWRRRFHEAPPGGSLAVELAPELLVREARAHTSVRVALAPAGRAQVAAVLTGGGEGDVRLWVLPPGSDRVPYGAAKPPPSPPVPVQVPAAPMVSKVLRGHSSRITGLHLDNSAAISLSLDGSVKVWDLQENHLGGLLCSARLPEGREASSLSCSGPDIVVGSVDGRAYLFTFRQGGGGGGGGGSQDRSVRDLVMAAGEPSGLSLGLGDEPITARELQMLYDTR